MFLIRERAKNTNKQIWKLDISLECRSLLAVGEGERETRSKQTGKTGFDRLSLAGRRLGFGQRRRGEPKETPGAS